VRARRTLAPLALVVVLVVGAVMIARPFSGGGGHALRAEVTSAEQLARGLEVRIAGRKVGKLGRVELVGRHAVVQLKIEEGDVWPLPVGTTAEIRWGSTTSLAYRYVELHPGPLSAPKLPSDALLSQTHTVTPVELDQAYRIFRGRTRGDLGALISELGGTLAANGGALQQGLRDAPGGLDQTSAVMRELGAEQTALHTLVTQGNDVTSALASRQGDLGGLVDHAAATFDEFARHTQAEQASLDQAPQALSTGTGTLGRLDSSLTGLQALIHDIAPGAIQLRALAPTARTALLELFRIGPLATQTLRRGTVAAPSLTRLLHTGTPFLPRLGAVLGQLDPMFACLRPYTPELAGQLSTWTGYNKNYDNSGHFARTFDLLFNPLLIAGTPLNTAQVVALAPGRLKYAMPRPPGLNAGQPWFQPQCGAGPDALNPSKDPEVGR
jgi:phospholipid/cholesterol/gamma-HCH transport system substrate-binding protein